MFNLTAEEKETANSILQQQSVPGALAAGLLCSIVLAFIWRIVGAVDPNIAGVMVLIAGAAIGYAVRFMGMGVGSRFQFIAASCVLSTCLFAAAMGTPVAGVDMISPIILLFLLLFSMAMAAWFSKQPLKTYEKLALFRVQMSGKAVQPIRNSWWVLVPGLLFGIVIAGALTVLIAELAGLMPQRAPSVNVKEYNPRKEGLDIGRNWGQFASSVGECSDMAQERLESCADDTACEQATPYILQTCIAGVKARAK